MNNSTIVRLLLLCIAVLFLAAGCASTDLKKAGDAKIAITPPAGKKGAAIAVNGTGFRPGEAIDITLDLADGRLVGLGTTKVEEIKADAAGAFKADTGIPTVAKPGTYKVTAEGDKGSKAKADLIVQP